MYSKEIKTNLQQRTKLLLKAKNNRELQQILKKKCQNSPLFFFNMFLFTYKPKAVWEEWEPTSPHFPFITYSFQDEFIEWIIKCVENWEDNITEKSREMWFSWMILWIALWWFLFRSWSGLIGSYKESCVDRAWDMDSLFERLRYMIERLPNWLKPEDLTCKYMNIWSKKLWASIAWDSWDAFGTWWRRKWVFLDEFSLWNNDEMAFRKTKDITNCRIFGGTPEWKSNVYWKIMTNHPDYKNIELKKFRLHWSSHPLKSHTWYEKQKKTRTKLDIAQELDISYDDSVSWAVYEDFDKLVKFEKLEYNEEYKLYTSWDFGRDSNVCQVWQKDFKYNKLYLLLSFRRVNRHIKQFAWLIIWEPTQWFKYTKKDFELMAETKKLANLYAWHFWDPYNWDSKSTNADFTIKEILSEFWIHISLKRDTSLETRITKTKLALNRIIIDYEQNIDCIESMRQSRYPKQKEASEDTREKRKPIHDENSHHRTAFEYFIDNEPKVLFHSIDSRMRNKYINRITGELMKKKN